jgi:Flp pilus assembly pilin Flp
MACRRCGIARAVQFLTSGDAPENFFSANKTTVNPVSNSPPGRVRSAESEEVMNGTSEPGAGTDARDSEGTGVSPGPGYAIYGLLIGLTAIVVIAVFVALGGPLRNMFANAVGTQTMGQQQASLSAGVYDGGSPVIAMARTDETADADRSNVTVHRRTPEPEEAMERSARVTVEVENVHATFEKTYNLILERKGRVLTSRVAQASSDDAVQARITAKVPPDDLNEIVAAIQTSGVIVSQDLQNTDHTDEIADIASRIEDHRLAAEQLRKKLADEKLSGEGIVNVRAELEGIRAEIDNLAGNRAALDARTDLASLEIQFVAADPHASLAFLDDFTRSLTRSSGLAVTLAGKGISLIVIALGASMPWCLLGWIAWVTIGRRAAKLLARTPAAEPRPAYAPTQESIS